MDREGTGVLASLSHWFRHWTPYEFVRLVPGGGEHVGLPLNRALKPLGVAARRRVRFGDYRAKAVVFRTVFARERDLAFARYLTL